MKIYPDYYLDGNYLRYIGWVLSDEVRPLLPSVLPNTDIWGRQQHKDVRQEAVKSLLAVYASEAHIGQVQHFTHRFKGQLVRMAVGEIDLTVRISALLVLRQIDKHGLLEEEQRESIGKLVFEEEKRVRNTVAGFFAGLLEERVEDKIEALEAARGGASDDSAELEEERKEKLRLKCLAELLVTFGKQLDERDDAAEDDEQNTHREDDDVVLDRTHRGRVAFAVEALWEHVDSLRDISALLDYLLLDHSVPSPDDMDTDDLPAPGKAKKDKKLSKKGVKAVEECYALKEEEETILVEVLVACLTRSNAIYAVAKKVSIPVVFSSYDTDDRASTPGQG
jgi:cohesin complex subunit SA-1/2